MTEWKSDKDIQMEIREVFEEWKPYHLCHDCQDCIDTKTENHLESRPYYLLKRIRCVKCGEHHQKFHKQEPYETWITPQPRKKCGCLIETA